MNRVPDERLEIHPRRVEDAVLAALLPFLVARSALVTVASTAAALLHLPASLGFLLVHGSLAAMVAVGLPAILRRADGRVGLVGGISLSAFVVGALQGQGSGQFYVEIAVGLVVGLGWMTVAFAIRDYRRCRRYLYAAAPMILVSVIIELHGFSSGTVDTESYSQYISYSALPAVLIFIDAAFERRRLLNGVLAISSGLLMLSAGARGPLVVAGLFIVARIIIQSRVSRRATIAAAAAGAAATWLLVQFSSNVLGSIEPVVTQFGLSTRVVARLLDGTLLEDRGRSALRDKTLNLISEHPLTGVGMSNERPILAQWMGMTLDTGALGWYPHNIFLEFWAQFGVILGTIIPLLLLCAILRVFVMSADLDRRALVLVFVGLGLLPLLFSASYLSWPPFFGLVGLCLVNNLPPQPAATGGRA